MLVKEMYEDSLYYEYSAMAHYINHLLTEKKISLDDEFSMKDLNQADHQKVAAMIQSNLLGFKMIGIYSLKMNQRDFVFIFARSQDEAIKFYTQSFHKAPLNCHEYLLEFEIYRENRVITFRDMRKEFRSFPAIAGYFTKD